MFYSSHKTAISVCPCVAGLYIGNIKSLATPPPPFFASGGGLAPYESNINLSMKDNKHWTFVKSGLPVLVLDSGESRRKRRLHIVLAEKGTGFSLWRDSIDHLSEYTVQSPTFHTMYLSNDHGRVVGFSFDNPGGAAELFKNLHHMTSDSSEKSVLNLSDGRLRKKKSTATAKESKTKTKGRLNKAAISQPCCFTHVTQLNGNDMSTVLRSSGFWPVSALDAALPENECIEASVKTVKVVGTKNKS